MFRSVVLVFIACGITNAQISTTLAVSTVRRCQYDNGTLKASATVCADDLSSCATIFGTPASGSRRPDLCNNEDMQDIAAKCSKTCGICCETPAYACTDTLNSPINCTTNKRFCTNAIWNDVMTQYCPATCGLCDSGSCVDVITGCNSMISLCENIHWYTYMQQNCARSCGACKSVSGPTCADVASNCAVNASLCDDSAFSSFMTENCAKTCNRCNGP